MGRKFLEQLAVWRKAKGFAVEVYAVLSKLPAEEKWGLNSQLRRAVQSIPANIAEGAGRYYYQETIRFCYIARGSLEETLSHLILAHELDYLPDEVFTKLAEDGEEVVRMLNGYIAYLKRSRVGENEPGAHSIKEESQEYDVLGDDSDPRPGDDFFTDESPDL